MAAYTKIIEFYGLPGCGKTTLCEAIVHELAAQGKKACFLNDITQFCTFFNVIRQVNFRELIHNIKFYIKNRNEDSSLIRYFSAYRRLLKYKCAIKYSNYDYVLVEHGIVQSMVSAIYKYDAEYYCDIDCSLRYILYANDNISYIYCFVDCDTAVRRIICRNRQNSGRLDKIKDKQVLTREIQKQYGLFEEICQWFQNSSFVNNSNKIDNTNNLDINVKKILDNENK